MCNTNLISTDTNGNLPITTSCQPMCSEVCDSNANSVNCTNYDISGDSPVLQYFNNKIIFITGVTGFCGKVMLEKMLRVLDTVDTVYVLMRHKGSKSAEQRLEQLLNGRAFSFHKYSPGHKKKVIAIDGDITKPKLGMDEDSIRLLSDKVDIIYHVAASVKFDAEFSFNYKQNTLGTKNVLDIAQGFNRLEQFVHVSTAYSNCHLYNVPEKLVPLTNDIDELMVEIDKHLENETGEYDWHHIGQGRPNSYVFTKALAEHYVCKHRVLKSKSGKQVYTSIVRPAIVFNAYNEPTFGWIDSFNGPSGFSLFIALGLIRYINLKFTNTVQLVPVDFLANFLLTLPAHLTQNASAAHEPNFYNLTSSPYMKMDMHSLFLTGFKYTHRYPSMYIVRPITVPPRECKLTPLQYRLLCFFSHDLWSYLMDGLLTLTGQRKKISIVRLMSKYQRVVKLLSPFVCQDWKFDTSNYEQVLNWQNKTDYDLFTMDMHDLKPDRLSESYVLGTRRFLMNEPDSTIKRAQIKYQWQLRFSKFIDFVIVFAIAFFVMNKVLSLLSE